MATSVQASMSFPAIALLLVLPTLLLAGEEAPEMPTPAELAAESDYVVLARLEVYDYEERRNIPVEGKAWFEVLVPYKVPAPTGRLRLYEQGVGGDRCYFDDVALHGEMPRYLLFLVEHHDPEQGDARGHPDRCALPVLVSTDNRYAVRWPIDGLDLPEDIGSRVRAFEFHGPGSTVDLRGETRHRREQRIEREFLEPVEGGRRAQYRYTRGIPLEDFRPLMGEQNLTRDRLQRGR